MNQTKKMSRPLTLTLIQDENLKNLAKFLKKVIIDTMIEYKEANGTAPVETYRQNDNRTLF